MRPRLPAEERRAAVLDTACRVFGRCSYRGATTAEIAREAGVTAVAREDDPGNWLPGMGRAFVAFKEHQAALANLWAQALAEAGDEPELRRHLGRHLRDVHEYVAGVVVRAQKAGSIPRDRDAEAEAWIFLAVGLLATVGGRLGCVGASDLERIRASRRRWLSAQ